MACGTLGLSNWLKNYIRILFQNIIKIRIIFKFKRHKFSSKKKKLLASRDSWDSPSREWLTSTWSYPLGCLWPPRTFTKCMDAALSPLRQMGIRILNYLDDWLILAQSEVELLSHRTLILSHLERLGLRVNFAKSALSPSQRVSFLGTVLDSAHMRAVIAPERALAIQKLAATFKSDTARPLKVFQRMLGLMAAASPVLQLGLLRMRPLQRWLNPRVPHNAWRHGRLHIRVNQACVTALTPWKNPQWMKKGVAMGLVHTRKVVMTDASNTGWGALCKGKPTFGHWSKAKSGFHIIRRWFRRSGRPLARQK